MEDIKINRKVFFNTVVHTLNKNESDDFSLKEEKKVWCFDDDVEEDNSWEIHSHRIFSILCNEQLLLANSKMNSIAFGVNDKTSSTIANEDEYITVEEARSAIAPILGTYPYLEEILSGYTVNPDTEEKEKQFFRQRTKKN